MNATCITLSFHQESVLIGYPRPLGISRVGPARKSSIFAHEMNRLLTKFGQEGRQLASCKNGLTQYRAILTPRLYWKKKTFIQIIPEENNLGELRLELNLKTVRISGKSLASSSEMISFQLPKQMVSALWLKYVIASGQNIAYARLSDSIVGTSKTKMRRARLGKGGRCVPSPRAFSHIFIHLFTERLFTTILEPGTG